MRRQPFMSCAPKHCAVMPVVPMRRKPNIQNTTFCIIVPTATAPMNASEPRCPATVVSHSPSSGMVMLLIMAGMVSRSISLFSRIMVVACRRAARRVQSYEIRARAQNARLPLRLFAPLPDMY